MVQNVLQVDVSRRGPISGPWKRFLHKILHNTGFQKIVVSTSNSLYQWAFDGIEIS